MRNPTSAWNARAKEFTVNLLLCTLSIAIFFGVAELLARIWYTPEEIRSEGHFEFDVETIFRQKKNHAGTYFGVPYTTNSYGHRGSRDYSVEKPKNTIRILVLGDSVAFGTKVLDSEAFPVLLEEKLSQYFTDQHTAISAEVINAAVPGNTPFQEYHDLQRSLLFNPDLVILQFTLNDVRENYGTWQLQNMGFNEAYASQAQFFDYLFGKKTLPLAFRADYLLRQKSAFYLFLKDLGNRIRFRDASGEHIADIAQQMEAGFAEVLVDDPQNPQILQEWEYALSWTRKTIQIAKENNIPLLLLVTPFAFQISRPEETAHPQRIMRELAEEQNITYVDLLHALFEEYAAFTGEGGNTSEIIAQTIQQNPEKLQDFWSSLFYDICHALPSGHKLIARILQPEVLKALHRTDIAELPLTQESSYR